MGGIGADRVAAVAAGFQGVQQRLGNGNPRRFFLFRAKLQAGDSGELACQVLTVILMKRDFPFPGLGVITPAGDRFYRGDNPLGKGKR